MPAKPISREYHLTKSQPRAKRREVANRKDTDQIEEQAYQAGVSETEKEEFLRKNTNGKRRYHHVS
jgi:hypothetical protein